MWEVWVCVNPNCKFGRRWKVDSLGPVQSKKETWVERVDILPEPLWEESLNDYYRRFTVRVSVHGPTLYVVISIREDQGGRVGFSGVGEPFEISSRRSLLELFWNSGTCPSSHHTPHTNCDRMSFPTTVIVHLWRDPFTTEDLDIYQEVSGHSLTVVVFAYKRSISSSLSQLTIHRFNMVCEILDIEQSKRVFKTLRP